MQRWIILLAYIPLLITVGYALAIYRKLDKPLKTFSSFLFLSGIIQSISAVLWLYGKNNMPLLHLFVATGFLCIGNFYNTVLKDFINRNILRTIMIGFLVFTVFNSIFLQDIYTFNSYALTLESILIIIFSLATFIFFLDESLKEVEIPSRKSLDWINYGLFIYYSSSLIIVFFGDVITRGFSKELNRYTWVLHNFFYVVMYCCFFIALWKKPAT
jgi:hypothetical protein